MDDIVYGIAMKWT